jgi:hypothetical protein
MSVSIVYFFDNVNRQGYLYNIYMLKFIDNNNSNNVIDKELFCKFKRVFKD